MVPGQNGGILGKEIEIVYSDGDLINKTLYDFDGNKINKSLSSERLKSKAML